MNNSTTDKLVQAYNQMLERAHQALEDAEPTIQHGIDKARKTAIELGELTHDEAEKIADYLKRDVQDAGKHLAETGHELADWLKFDLDQVEDQLLSVFSQIADKTKIEWAELQHTLSEDLPYHSGEITGPGTIYCASCNETLHFHHTARIPPCPKCKSGAFRRWPTEKLD